MSRARVMAEMDRAAAAGEVAMQRCTACGTLQYPPREMCAACLADALAWERKAEVAGEMLAGTMLHHSFDVAFAGRMPVRVGLVRIAGGPTAVCFLDAGCKAGHAVRVRAHADASGRAVLTAVGAP
jgi:uncharacterized OB-fold protein